MCSHFSREVDKIEDYLEKVVGLTDTRNEGDQLQLSHKELLSDRGFLVYVTRMYPVMVPYLNGFHLTIEMWRGGQDAEG